MSPRRIALAGAALVLVAAVVAALVVGDPFGGSSQTERRHRQHDLDIAGDGHAPVTVLTDAGECDARLCGCGRASAYLRGRAPSVVQQAQQAVRASEGMLRTAIASLSADRATLAGVRATLSAAREKESVDCVGDNAAQGAPGASSPSGEAASAGSPSGASSSVCASDVATVTSDGQGSSGDAMKVSSDRAVGVLGAGGDRERRGDGLGGALLRC